LIGLVRLESRRAQTLHPAESQSWGILIKAVLENRQASLFFWYLIILLAAILGQDILLEPFGGEAFGMAVKDTTRITSIWGGCVLLALVIAGAFEGRVAKRLVASIGALVATLGFILIVASGLLLNQMVFYTGVVLLGSGTGLATVSNLSLMLDMTTPSKVGLFIGAWGMANAISRLIGSVLGGAVRDLVTQLSHSPIIGYIVVFGIEAGLLLISLLILRQIDVGAFQQQSRRLSLTEQAALSAEA